MACVPGPGKNTAARTWRNASIVRPGSNVFAALRLPSMPFGPGRRTQSSISPRRKGNSHTEPTRCAVRGDAAHGEVIVPTQTQSMAAWGRARSPSETNASAAQKHSFNIVSSLDTHQTQSEKRRIFPRRSQTGRERPTPPTYPTARGKRSNACSCA